MIFFYLHDISFEKDGFNSQLPVGKLKLHQTKAKTVKDQHGLKIPKKYKKYKKFRSKNEAKGLERRCLC
jgi:hypothetical protein